MTTPSSTTTAPARFLLLGDSHTGPIGRAAEAARIPFQGGPIGAGREFTDDFFEARTDDVVFGKPEAEQYYRKFLGELGITTLGELPVPLVSTFGFAAHFVATTENWSLYRLRDNTFEPGFLGSALFDAIVTAVIRDALALYRHARALGLRVLAVLPPQRVPPLADPAVFLAAQETIRRAVTALGVEVVDLRARITDATGFQRRELCQADDEIHGNLAWGRIVLRELLDRGL
ncbi:SGNH/GDSL hydrolase family protein [Nocardia brasiliensis]|uniref:SGNH/GDSL hydrolase family protein n=1 Tax=Nocardia brasiliensis TaxID=37326 RepID=UPI0004A7103D|nr:SGNH/GDSL hydrolase family protein [Nocardia brasiliensis]